MLFFPNLLRYTSPDKIKAVHASLLGATLQKSITHTNLVLIQKKVVIQTFLILDQLVWVLL